MKGKHGGKRQGAGRKRKVATPAVGHGNSQQAKSAANDILEALNRPASESDSFEIQKFRQIDDAGVRESLDLRRWLYDKRDGKASQAVELGGKIEFDLRARRERIRTLISRLAGDARS